jgi:hypothetical protein
MRTCQSTQRLEEAAAAAAAAAGGFQSKGAMENNGGRRGVETRGRRTRRGTQTTKTTEIGHERKIHRDTQKPNSNQI